MAEELKIFFVSIGQKLVPKSQKHRKALKHILKQVILNSENITLIEKEINEGILSAQEKYNLSVEEFKNAFFSLKINKSAG